MRSSAQRLLGFTPELFPVSARLAMRAKRGEPALWAASGFEALEGFITTTLDERGRFQLKLANPLGVGHALAARYATMAEERLTLLNEDMAVLEDIDRQRAVHREDLARGFDLRMTAVEKVLLDMEQRGHAFFEDTLRLGRVMDLLNRSRVQKEFEQRVVGDAPRQIERNVSELIDWLIDQDFRQWQAVTGVLSARSTDHRARMRGTPEVGTFHYGPSGLIDSVGREAQRVVDTYDREREAAAIAEQARAAVTTAAAAGGAALGLGTTRGAGGVERGGGHHRNSAGERRRLDGLPRDPCAQTEGQARDAGEGVAVAGPAGGRAARGVRAGARTWTDSHRRCDRAVQPVRQSRARTLDRREIPSDFIAGPGGHVPQPSGRLTRTGQCAFRHE